MKGDLPYLFVFLFGDIMFDLVILSIVLGIYAQIKVKGSFRKYSQVYNRRGVTAYDAARRILDENGLYNVMIEHVSGNLTDHYDPRTNVIRLSDSVYGSTSVAAIGVAAHEAGHAVQYAQEYTPIKIRASIIPVTQIGSSLAVPLVFLGLLFSRFLSWLIPVGIILYIAVVFFQAVTLPVEFNASRRAMDILRNGYVLDDDELKMAKSVLSAAALTYVAAMVSSLVSLLRLILIAGGGRRGRR